MALRDRFRRALRRSESSDTTIISHTESNTTTTTTTTSTSSPNTSETSSSHKPSAKRLGSNKLARFLSRRTESDSDKDDRRSRRGKIHPSQRPLTKQNLMHQEMLGHFTMTFGASDPSQIESLSFTGVSPCCTRAPSIEIDRALSSRLLSAASPAADSDRD